MKPMTRQQTQQIKGGRQAVDMADQNPLYTDNGDATNPLFDND